MTATALKAIDSIGPAVAKELMRMVFCLQNSFPNLPEGTMKRFFDQVLDTSS